MGGIGEMDRNRGGMECYNNGSDRFHCFYDDLVGCKRKTESTVVLLIIES